MSLITRYLLRLHLAPFVFSLSAMTGILLVNQIARRMKDLVGKGLEWQVMAEVFGLSIPFIVAMTLPMAVLVSVLFAVSRLSTDSELTAFRAGGVSLGRMVTPLVLAGIGMTVFAFLFSDQVLPRTNHRLRTLLTDISRQKPTFALEEQIINEVQRSRMFMRAGRVDQSTYTLRDVTIVDVSDHNRKRVTYADSAHMAFAGEDLLLTLFDGSMHETDRVSGENFQVASFRQDRIVVEGLRTDFSRTLNDTFKSDREMGVCEMDSVVTRARSEYWSSVKRAQSIEINALRGLVGLAPVEHDTIPPEGPRNMYCHLSETVRAALRPAALEAQETTAQPAAVQTLNEQAQAAFAGRVSPPRINTARVLRDRARDAEIRAANYLVELHKKYAIAVACIVFVLVGIPAAIKFPRGGIGLVVGMSLVIFSIYYIGLIAGESMANKLYVPPFWAMWTPNIVFGVLGCLGLYAVRTEATGSRGADNIFGRLLARSVHWLRRAA